MRTIPAIAALAFAVALAACSSNPNIGDAKRQYLSPALCEKQLECIGQPTFEAAYGGGVDSCKKKLEAEIPESQNEQESACSDEDWQACSRDLKAGTCPSDPSKGGLPDLPASCQKC